MARYPERTKLRAIAAAELGTVLGAAKATGVPRTTLIGWLADPKYDSLRQKTREDLADEFRALAHLALAKLAERIQSGEIESRDLIPAMGVATEKSLLLTGSATSRTESRDLTGTLSDSDLSVALHEAVSLTAPGGGSEAATEPSEG